MIYPEKVRIFRAGRSLFCTGEGQANVNKNKNTDTLSGLAITFGGLFAVGSVIQMLAMSRVDAQTVIILLLGIAAVVWGVNRLHSLGLIFFPARSRGRAPRCPNCHQEIGGYVSAGSQAYMRVSKGLCPHCGASMPTGFRIGFKR